MLIYSQNKDAIANIENGVYVSQGTHIVSGDTAIGEYHSNERCKEILANMIESFKKGQDVFRMPLK